MKTDIENHGKKNISIFLVLSFNWKIPDISI